MLEVFADGSSLGNPGNAGAGLVLYKNKKIMLKKNFFIGTATNNVAEYVALILALQEALACGVRPVNVYMDSELVTRQVRGEYKVKNAALYPLSIIARNLCALIGECSLVYRPREENKLADSLARAAAKDGNSRVGRKGLKGRQSQFTFE